LGADSLGVWYQAMAKTHKRLFPSQILCGEKHMPPGGSGLGTPYPPVPYGSEADVQTRCHDRRMKDDAANR